MKIFRFLCVISLLQKINGQQRPSFDTKTYAENVTHRSNFCSIHSSFNTNKSDLRVLLQGKNISIALFDYQLNANGVIDDINPDISIRILDELAKRAGFEYRNSYGVLDRPAGNETFTSTLYWARNTYDLIGEWYSRSIERIENGVIYTDGWYDASLIIVTKKEKEENLFSFFAFLEPFTNGLWAFILLTTLLSGVVYYAIDLIDSTLQSKEMDTNFVGNLYEMLLTMVGHNHQEPKSTVAYITLSSTSMLCVIIVAAYTANLASFLIKKNTPALVINSIDDVIGHQLRVCLWKGSGSATYMRNKYPKYTGFVGRPTEISSYTGIEEGACDVVVTYADTWKSYERDTINANKNCSLQWVGRAIDTNWGSFPLDDSQTYCSSILRNILNIFLFEMEADGTRDDIWNQHRNGAQGTDICVNKPVLDQDLVNDALASTHLGGILIVHVCIIVIALIYSIFAAYFGPKQKRDLLKDKVRSMIVSRHDNGPTGRITCKADLEDTDEEADLNDTDEKADMENKSKQKKIEAIIEKKCTEIKKELENVFKKEWKMWEVEVLEGEPVRERRGGR